MTDPLLWLNGDPTEGRRLRVPEPAPERAAAPPPPEPAPASPPSPRRRFGAAVAGGAVSATLVAAGALALGLVDTGDPPAAAQPPGPASAAVSPRQQGDIAAIYRAASPAVVSVRAGSGSGTGFVVDTGGTVVTNAHVVGDSEQVELQFSDDRTVTADVAGVDTSSDLAVLHVDPAQAGTLTALELA